MLIDIFIVDFVCIVCIPSFVPGETKKYSFKKNSRTFQIFYYIIFGHSEFC